MDEQCFWMVVNVELLVPLAIVDDEGLTSEEYLSGCRISAGITGQSLSSAQKRLVRLITEITSWQREWFVVDYCRVSTIEKEEIKAKLASVGAGEDDLLHPPELSGVWFHTHPKYQTQKED